MRLARLAGRYFYSALANSTAHTSKKYRPLLHLCLGVVALLVGGCSAEKDTFVARNWHNLLAHYNSYHLAREKMTEVELATWQSITDNYNRPLAILPPAGQAKGNAAALEEIVKKGSIPIQRHKNSDWVDDAYLLIGKARYYQDDYENAVHTFKYLVYKAKDENVKHAAIVWLLRTYTDLKEYTFAQQATEAALGNVLNKQNKKDFYLAMAHYHTRFKEWPEVLGYVEEALPLMKRNLYRARMEFLAGQLRQRMGDDSLANLHYRMVRRCSPPYELDFNARVNAAQTQTASDAKGAKEIRKYFKKQLRDEKNLEFKDKVYYEMARFELKQNQVPMALDFATLSLKEKVKTKGQNGYTYWLKGKIYYDKQRRFDKAKLYYDSAVAALDTADEQYKAVAKRQKVLVEFVKHYEVITLEDSLRGLAGLNDAALVASLSARATDVLRKKAELSKLAEKEARRAEREEAGRQAAGASGSANPNGAPGGLPDPTAAASGEWYFYNATLVARGNAAFARKWGRRPLEDNWRRSKKEQEEDDENGQGNTAATAGQKQTDPAKETGDKIGAKKEKGAAKEKAAPLTEAQEVENLVKEYKAGLPLTPAALAESDKKLMPALLAISKIYDQKLEEPANAIASLSRLTVTYPAFEKDPEALYNLFIIYSRQKKAPKADSVKNVLVAKYPDDLYAKLALDPQYAAKSRLQTEAAKVLYKKAYTSYKEGMYVQASQALASLKTKYPENNFKDRVDLLSALLTAKTIDAVAYSDSLKAVAARYPKSELTPTLKDMQTLADAYNKPKNAPAQAADTSKVGAKQGAVVAAKEPAASGPAKWALPGNGPFLFVAVLRVGMLTEEEAMHYLTEFNKLFFTQENLTTTTAPFTPEFFIARAAELRNPALAKVYMAKQESLDGAYDFLDPRADIYLTMPENYRELMRTKDLDGFKNWCKDHPVGK